MTIFYNLHVNNDYNNAMLFSMGFIGYIDNISAIHSLYKNKHITMCKFSNKKTKFKMHIMHHFIIVIRLKFIH